jgi:16S rRNA processing protein RimM
VGTIRGPHGIAGEVRVEVTSDVPDRFRAGARLGCAGVGDLEVQSARPAPRRRGSTAEVLLVRFRGYADRDAAETLRDRALTIERAEARRALAGAHLWADLIGLRAEDPAGAALGTVTEVLRAGETDVLVVARDGGGELLLPALESVVREVDVAGGRIVVRPQEVMEP